MKRIGVLFFSLVLFLNSAFADGEKSSLNNSFDLQTVQTLCKKMFEYADSHELRIAIDVEGKTYNPQVAQCDDNNVDAVFDITVGAAEFLKVSRTFVL